MDLVKFNDGAQNVAIYDSGFPMSPQTYGRSTHFVPPGEPVIRHTDMLFSAKTSYQGLLISLASPESNVSFDPISYDALARQTKHALLEMKRNLSLRPDASIDVQNDLNQSNIKDTLHSALAVINELEEDRDLLITYQRALQKA